MLLHSRVPVDHLSTESKDVVKLAMGLIATMAALVLGLLTASAKALVRYAEQRGQAHAAKIILTRPDAGPLRPRDQGDPRSLRDAVASDRPDLARGQSHRGGDARQLDDAGCRGHRGQHPRPLRRRTTPSGRCRPKRCKSAAICPARAGCCSPRPAARPRCSSWWSWSSGSACCSPASAFWPRATPRWSRPVVLCAVGGGIDLSDSGDGPPPRRHGEGLQALALRHRPSRAIEKRINLREFSETFRRAHLHASWRGVKYWQRTRTGG